MFPLKKIIVGTFIYASTIGVSLANSSSTHTEENAHTYAEKGLRYAEEFPGLTNICDITSPFRIAGQRPKQASTASPKKEKRRSTPLPPTQVFDNLYYVGTGGVASWVIKTSEGLIVIDALNNNAQAKEYIEQGLITLGLDPKTIKYLIITHGHGDHYGGQEYLVNHYHPRVVMMDVEWKRLERPIAEIQNPRWGKKPLRDVSAKDGEIITLGQTSLHLYLTPGHTPGTLSLIFPVYEQGKQHMASLWGGTGLNYGPNEPRILSYSKSAARFHQLAKDAGVDVFLSNHPTRDGTSQKIQALRQNIPSTPNPFIIGQEQALHAFDLLRDCTYAQVLRIREKRKHTTATPAPVN